MSTVRLFLVSAKTDNLVDGVCDASLGTIEPNGVLKYGHNLCMSTSRWICLATDTVDVKERKHYAAWFANLALHRDAAVLGLNERQTRCGNMQLLPCCASSWLLQALHAQ